MEQIAGLILVMAIVVGALMFIFKPDILNYIRVLPRFNLPENDTIVDVSQWPSDMQIIFEQQCEKNNLAYRGKSLEGTFGWRHHYIYFLKKYQGYDLFEGGRTPFYYDGDDKRNGVLMWDNRGGNDEIGTVNNYRVVIKDEWLKGDWVDDVSFFSGQFTNEMQQKKILENQNIRTAMILLNGKEFFAGDTGEIYYICTPKGAEDAESVTESDAAEGVHEGLEEI